MRSTSDQPRNDFVVGCLADAFDVRVVLREPKAFDPSGVEETAADAALLSAYFAERDRSEAQWMGDHRDVRAGRTLTVPAGSPNTTEYEQAIRNAGVAAVCVFGSSLLEPGYLAHAGVPVINLHLGLSRY
jgi:hypothetical protein